MKHKSLIVIGLTLTAAVLLAACGGGAEQAESTDFEPVIKTLDELVAEYPGPPEDIITQGNTYTATLVTEKGDIVVNLFADQVPFTVNNFVWLACEGFYDNTTFHRVVADFMAQAGDPTGTGMGGPGYRFGDEFVPGLLHSKPGILSMANSGANTNGSQFFITFVPTPWLDGAHSVFGEVADEASLEVLFDISIHDPQSDPDPGDVLATVLIQENGEAFCR